MHILNNPARLAKLLASIKVFNKSNRPLSPMDVAREIETLQKDLNNDQSELIKRLPIKLDMIKQFQSLLRLPPQVQDMVVWGETMSKTGVLGFSVAAKIAMFDNSNDVLKLVGTVTDISRPLTKENVKHMLSMKKHNPGTTIEECLSEILNVTRPITITHYMFVSGLGSDIVQVLKKLSQESNQDINQFAADVLRKIFPKDCVENVKIFTDYVRLSLTKEGMDFITKYSTSHDVLRQNVLNHMFESGGFLNDRQRSV